KMEGFGWRREGGLREPARVNVFELALDAGLVRHEQKPFVSITLGVGNAPANDAVPIRFFRRSIAGVRFADMRKQRAPIPKWVSRETRRERHTVFGAPNHPARETLTRYRYAL